MRKYSHKSLFLKFTAMHFFFHHLPFSPFYFSRSTKMLRQCSTVLSVLKKSKRFCSRLSEFRPPLTFRGLKLKAEINWIIPDIMTNTSKTGFREEVFHESPQFFDAKDDQLNWYLRIVSHRGLFSLSREKNVVLFVHLLQPENSIFAATYTVVVSDEKKDQSSQLISRKETCSPRFLDSNDNDIAESFTIASLEEAKMLKTVSVHCIIEYRQIM